jgi:hypothetical protein
VLLVVFLLAVLLNETTQMADEVFDDTAKSACISPKGRVRGGEYWERGRDGVSHENVGYSLPHLLELLSG